MYLCYIFSFSFYTQQQKQIIKYSHPYVIVEHGAGRYIELIQLIRFFFFFQIHKSNISFRCFLGDAHMCELSQTQSNAFEKHLEQLMLTK